MRALLNKETMSHSRSSAAPAFTMKTAIATLIAIVMATSLIRVEHPTQTVVAAKPTVTKAANIEKQAEKVAEPVKEEVKSAEVAAPESTVVETPVQPAQVASGSTCASEVLKYTSWNQDVAMRVMIAESGGNVATNNNDPSTGDLSQGCFQINLLGTSNLTAKYRTMLAHGYTDLPQIPQMQTWLHDPANNVAVAEDMYRSSGWRPWAYTCANKVQCY